MTETPERVMLAPCFVQINAHDLYAVDPIFWEQKASGAYYVRADIAEAERERLRETIRRYVQLFGALPD